MCVYIIARREKDNKNNKPIDRVSVAHLKGTEQKVNLEHENRTSDGFVFFVDPASHYHGAAGSEKEIKKNGREGIFF